MNESPDLRNLAAMAYAAALIEASQALETRCRELDDITAKALANLPNGKTPAQREALKRSR